MKSGKRGKKEEEIIKKNTEEMRSIIKEYGWPGISLVGKKGAEAVWLLVQHSDRDLNFQKKCLALMREAVKKKEASKVNLAYLTDRVLVNSGKKQIYGTQIYKNKEGQFLPRPIYDKKELDKRRKSFGLPPLKEYIEKIKEMSLK